MAIIFAYRTHIHNGERGKTQDVKQIMAAAPKKYLSNVTHRQPWRMRGLGGCRRGGCHAAGIADHSGHQVVEDLAYKNENFIFVNFLSQPSKK